MNTFPGQASKFRDADIWGRCRGALEGYVEVLYVYLQQLQPLLLWTIVYGLVLGSAYLFHSPFRVHSTSRSDSYARLTRVFQTWCTLVMLCFHLGPHFAQETRAKLKGVRAGQETITVIFFPTFVYTSGLFLGLHKMKRRLRLGVTYGPNLSIVLLNSIVLAVVATVHCGYGLHWWGASLSPWMAAIRQLLFPQFATEFPLVVIMHLFGLILVFIWGDYMYKRRYGFDPARGILWSELYDLKKGSQTLSAPVNARETDWRTLEQMPTQWRDRRAGTSNFGQHGDLRSILSGKESKLFEEKNGGGSATAAGMHSAGDIPPESSNPLQAPGQETRESHHHSYVSYALSRAEVKELREAQHPVNRPGMVAWWSTFVIGTAWQALASSLLGFLSFDVRALQGLSTPKIFDLSFYSSVADAVRASATALTGSSPIFPANGAGTGTCSTDPRDSGGEDDVGAPGRCTAPSPRTEKLPDVWFDWVADVGDGFNPTYEMARLMAMPALTIPIGNVRRATRATATGGGWIYRLLTKGSAFWSSPEAQSTAASGVGPVDQLLGRMNDSTPITASCGRSSIDVGGLLHASLALSGANMRGESLFSEEGFSAKSTDTLRAADDSALHLSSFLIDEASDDGNRWPGTLRRLGVVSSRSRVARKRITLPRASFVVIGGDLAYPTPTDETYNGRLFEPYGDAMRGNDALRRQLHEHQKRIVVPDSSDPDVAHIHLLDAATVSCIASGGDPLRSNHSTAEEALRSVPLLFAHPGNHDWFDGLSTFTKFFIHKSWMGGWLLPQRSSYFVICLPYNWFLLCCDTGNRQDIDVTQRNYFLSVIEKYMNAESCVILTCHEPGWVFDAMLKTTAATQPEIHRLVSQLGTRLRLRLAGDLHYYSRHTPLDPVSEAATLIVSGGGGAYLYGSRNDKIMAQGTTYRRASAFPQTNTYLPIATRLWGFRVINWKFDLVLGFACFALVLSTLPLPRSNTSGLTTVPALCSYWLDTTFELLQYLFSHAIISLVSLACVWMGFSVAGVDRGVPLWWRALYGGLWTLLVLVTCCGTVAWVSCQLIYLSNNGMLQSTKDKWGSFMEDQARLYVDHVTNRTRKLIGEETAFARLTGNGQLALYNSALTNTFGVVLRSLDPVETLNYLWLTVQSGRMGEFAPSATRSEIFLYYLHIMFFFWIVATPLVSFLIGCFLFVSVTAFDYMYDGAYAAFQIEDFKHFVRFRLDAKTRVLQGYVVAERTVPKVWEIDPRHTADCTRSETKNLPPHLHPHPSRWRPSFRDDRTMRSAFILENFTVRPHRVTGEREERVVGFG